jgi:hypothetical protein
MAILEDSTLLVKKIAVTIIIYLVPVSILVGGLLLTKHLLSKPNEKVSHTIQETSSISESKPQ